MSILNWSLSQCNKHHCTQLLSRKSRSKGCVIFHLYSLKSQTYLKSTGENKFSCYKGRSNKYEESIKIFTKVVKPPLSPISKKRTFLCNNSWWFIPATQVVWKMPINFHDKFRLLRSFGFIIHSEKSVLVPVHTQKILVSVKKFSGKTCVLYIASGRGRTLFQHF